MEMEQWDNGTDSFQENSNINTVVSNGDNAPYHQIDQGGYNNNDSNGTNTNNNNHANNRNFNQVNRVNNYANDNNNYYSNQSRNNNYNNNYSNYNRRFESRNNNYNNNNNNHNNNNNNNYNNNYRRRDFNYNNRREQYRGGYGGNRYRNRGKYRGNNYGNRGNYGGNRRQRNAPYYQPKQTKNNHNNQIDNSTDNTPPHQQPHGHITDTNPPPIASNKCHNQPSRPYRPKRKFTGRQIDDSVGMSEHYHPEQDNNNNYKTAPTQWEVDESQAQIRTSSYQQNSHKYSKPRKPRNALELENLGDRPKEMALQLINGTYDCMVCQSFIGKKARIWKCQHCYTMFHIMCVNKWARAREQKDAESERRAMKPDRSIEKVRCPACNYVHVNFKFNQYKCFCDKVIFDHEYQSKYQYIPHSCGDICAKKRGAHCPHSCPAICHPGPCEPCTLPSDRKSQCPCGKLTYSLLCGDETESKARLCKQSCLKMLKCGNHQCPLKCHEGQCKACDIKTEQTCFCGKHRKLQPCGTGIKMTKCLSADECKENGQCEWKYSCADTCDKALSCQHHKCTLICHNGSCSGCPRRIDTPTRCACGKSTSPVVRTSCLDALPVCKNKCARMLSCGQHFCRKPCHDSKCAFCSSPVKKRCRCGASEKKFKCHDYAKRLKQFVASNETAVLMEGADSWIRCGKKCKRVKSCGKHICAEKCCRGRTMRTFFEAHQCREFCNKPLTCGRHRCSSYCHRGQCNPCGVTYRNGVECACGAVFVEGPFQCGTKEIPVCGSTCDKVNGCGHLCCSKCHHGACPPCVRICSKPCISHGLLVHNMPCHVDSRSCGNPCGKLLDCKVHKCSRTCHVGLCGESESKTVHDRGVLGCGQICALMLKCGHKCMYKCHGNKCNADLCKAQISVKCQCGENSEKQYCRGRTEYDLKAVPCTEECQIAERNKRFREALKISNKKKKRTEGKESDLMVPFAASVLERILKWMHEDKSHSVIIKQDKKIMAPKFVYFMEGLLAAFIGDKSADCKAFKSQYVDVTVLISSKSGGAIINLKPMSVEQRFIVYSMVTHYHIRAEKKENSGKYGLSYIELSKTKHTRLTDYLLSKALMEYQLRGDEIKTLECMPPRTIIVIENGEEISSAKIQDRLLAWTGDYRMFRNNASVYIVFTDQNARNSAMTQMRKLGARKATQSDSLNVVQYKKNQQRKKNQNKKQQQQHSNNDNDNFSSQSNAGWSTVGNAHVVTGNMTKHKPPTMNIKMNNRFG